MQRENNNEEKIKINGEKMKIAVVVSKFNKDLTSRMLEGALEVLREHNVKVDNVKVVWVPGSFELPLACQRLASEKKYDGIVAIGCVMKGETDHHLHIAREVSRAIMDVMLNFSVPIGFGLVTANTLEQAIARSYGESNKGVEAASATLEMIAK